MYVYIFTYYLYIIYIHTHTHTRTHTHVPPHRTARAQPPNGTLPPVIAAPATADKGNPAHTARHPHYSRRRI